MGDLLSQGIWNFDPKKIATASWRAIRTAVKEKSFSVRS
jgi:hypothetical protein